MVKSQWPKLGFHGLGAFHPVMVRVSAAKTGNHLEGK